MEDADTCPICFDIFTNPKILNCGHTFCFKCLKDFSDEISSDQREFGCPLCRTKCNRSAHGTLDHLLSNYFKRTSELDKCCLNCRKSETHTVCNICGLYLCKKCFKSHIHVQSDSKKELDEEESTRESGRHLHMLLPGVRTKLMYKLETQFVVETPPDDDGHHVIYCIRLSSFGGVLVVPRGIPFIIQFNQHGKILDRIRTPHQCIAITELTNGSLIGTFPVNDLVLKYAFGGWSNFARCSEFFPTDLVELSNGNILLCGPSKPLSKVKRLGYLQIFSPYGEPLKRLDKSSTDEIAMFRFPHICAYDRKQRTIVVADQDSNTVTFLKEDDESFHTYKGGNELSLPFQFHPWGLCQSPNGLFVVSTPESCLHILDNTAKLRAVALTDDEDGFGRDVVIDQNGTIWCTDTRNGTVKTFKLTRYRNDFGANNLPCAQSLFQQFLLQLS